MTAGELTPASLQPPLGAGGSRGRGGAQSRCVGNQITEMTLSAFQSSAEELHQAEFPKLTLSYVGGICQRGANFSTGKVRFFPFSAQGGSSQHHLTLKCKRQPSKSQTPTVNQQAFH